MARGALVVLVALAAVHAAPARSPAAPGSGRALPAFAPGPFAVGRWDWDFGTVNVSPVFGTTPLTVQHYGTVRYPAQWNGRLAPVAPGYPFPFVVFAHGRYQLAPYTGSNHLEAGYLLDHLASWGFVVASVNLDVVGSFSNPPAIPQRGELIHATIAAFEALDPQHIVVDFDRAGLVGHSRGGEGCLAAWSNNPAGHPLRAIATIAPTNFQHYALLDLPYLGLYGSKDGDVNNGMPIQAWDAARQDIKAFEYIEGANHFWFTDDITYSGEGNADITREQHHDAARLCITEFLLRELAPGGPQPVPVPQLCDGEGLWPLTAAVTVHPMYTDPGALVVNDFEDAPENALLNSLGGLSLGNLLVTQDEESLAQGGKTFWHQTSGGWIAHSLPPPSLPFYAEELPPGTDVSGFDCVSLRVLQRWGAALNPTGQPQNLRVALADAAVHIAVLRLSDYGTIPWPITHSGNFPKKSVLRTTRIPLADFLAKNPALDLTNLRFVALVLDQTPSSELRIDDLQFSD